MAQRVAEHVVRRRLFGPRQRLRVDLHGVSLFGAAGEKALIRWEWMEGIDVDRGAVVVRSATDTITLPSGAFGLAADDLVAELRRARSIQDRSEVIGRLGGSGARTADP